MNNLSSRLTKRGMPGWLALILSILMVVVLLGWSSQRFFFSVTKLSTELPIFTTSASEQASEDLSSTTDSETTAEVEADDPKCGRRRAERAGR